MTLEDKRAYTEVLIILENLDLIENLPKELVNEMKKNKDENYIFKFNKYESLEEQKISKRSMILLSTIYLAYICEDDEEKKQLKNIYDENEKKLIETTKISNILNKEENEYKKTDNNMLMSTTINKNIFSKIISCIKSFFKNKLK